MFSRVRGCPRSLTIVFVRVFFGVGSRARFFMFLNNFYIDFRALCGPFLDAFPHRIRERFLPAFWSETWTPPPRKKGRRRCTTTRILGKSIISSQNGPFSWTGCIFHVVCACAPLRDINIVNLLYNNCTSYCKVTVEVFYIIVKVTKYEVTEQKHVYRLVKVTK